MTRRRTIVGLCILCALFISAIAAHGASAAGTTAYTCKDTGTAGFSDAHCTEASPAGPYSHVAIANNTTTELTGSAAGVLRFKATIGGISTELVASTFDAAGWMENREEVNEMYAFGEGTGTFTNVTVASPANKGCKVFTDVEPPLVKGEEGVIHTTKLKGTTQNQGDFVRFEPAIGTIMAKFIISGCTGTAAIEALNKTYTVTGSIKGVPKGATVKFSHAEVTAAGATKINGTINAGFEGEIEFEGRHPGTGGGYTPLAATT